VVPSSCIKCTLPASASSTAIAAKPMGIHHKPVQPTAPPHSQNTKNLTGRTFGPFVSADMVEEALLRGGAEYDSWGVCWRVSCGWVGGFGVAGREWVMGQGEGRWADGLGLLGGGSLSAPCLRIGLAMCEARVDCGSLFLLPPPSPQPLPSPPHPNPLNANDAPTPTRTDRRQTMQEADMRKLLPVISANDIPALFVVGGSDLKTHERLFLELLGHPGRRGVQHLVIKGGHHA